MRKMVGEYMRINREDINTLDHGKKTRRTAMVDRKHQLLSTKVILSEIKKKDLELLQKKELDMRSLGKMTKRTDLVREYKKMDNKLKYTILMESNQQLKIIA